MCYKQKKKKTLLFNSENVYCEVTQKRPTHMDLDVIAIVTKLN